MDLGEGRGKGMMASGELWMRLVKIEIRERSVEVVGRLRLRSIRCKMQRRFIQRKVEDSDLLIWLTMKMKINGLKSLVFLESQFLWRST